MTDTPMTNLPELVKAATPVETIRAVFAECEAREARFKETGKPTDYRAWKRHGGVLEVICVGHMRKALDEIEAHRALAALVLEAAEAFAIADEIACAAIENGFYVGDGLLAKLSTARTTLAKLGDL